MNSTILNKTNIYFRPENVQGLEKKILDELSDGQWHPEYKIKKEIGESKVLDSLKNLEEQRILIAGENNSFRMDSTILAPWREHTDFAAKDTPRYTPRYFGGILEDDGWNIAQLKTYDLIHFRVNGDISKADIESIINYNGSITRSENGLHRIFSQNHGDEVYEQIKNHKFEDPSKSFSGVRLEKGIKRRDINDLPHRYTAELCNFYGSFAKVLLRPNMSSITKHISEHDDIQQQIYLWVIDAVQRYDHTTSIPFAAFLSKMLSKWVFNLGRQSFGRSVADIEIKHSRITNQLRNELDREPTLDEVASALGESVSQVKDQRATITSVANMRTIETIDDEESTVHIASVENTTQQIEEYVTQNLLSTALTEAMMTKQVTTTDGLWEEETLNTAGFLAVYHETWGNPKNKKLLPAIPNLETMKRKLLDDTQRIMREHDSI